MLIRFLRDRGANVASIFALTLIPLLSATGAAVDYSYAFRLRTITQDALDAAALAGGRMIGVNTEAEIKTEVDKFFISNVANRLDTIPSVSQAISGATITLNTTLDVPTHFLGVIGLDDFHFPLTSQVTSRHRHTGGGPGRRHLGFDGRLQDQRRSRPPRRISPRRCSASAPPAPRPSRSRSALFRLPARSMSASYEQRRLLDG